MPEQSYSDQLRERQKRFTRNIAHLIAFAFENGFELTFGEAYRTREQQEIHFNAKPPRTKTMDSPHMKRLAVDFNIIHQGRLLFKDDARYKKDLELMRPLGEQWTSYHPDNIWGGDWNRNGILDETFRDPYHFEMKF
jgi:hypothetical protein